MDIVEALLKQRTTISEIAEILKRLEQVERVGLDIMDSILKEYAKESGHDFDDKRDVTE